MPLAHACSPVVVREALFPPQWNDERNRWPEWKRQRCKCWGNTGERKGGGKKREPDALPRQVKSAVCVWVCVYVWMWAQMHEEKQSKQISASLKSSDGFIHSSIGSHKHVKYTNLCEWHYDCVCVCVLSTSPSASLGQTWCWRLTWDGQTDKVQRNGGGWFNGAL